MRPGPEYPPEWDLPEVFPPCPVCGRGIEDDAEWCSVACQLEDADDDRVS